MTTNHTHERNPANMAGDTLITIIGNLAADPELRFTPSGAAVTNFRVLSTPRTLNKQTNEWVDGETLGISCAVWRDAAENVAESLTRGARVIVTGRLKSRSYETKDGEKRTVIELDVDEVGPSLRYASAKVTKTGRSQGAATKPTGQVEPDPWVVTPPSQGGWAAPSYDEAPF